MNKTGYCSLNGVLIIEVSQFWTAYCGPNGVLYIEVSLYTFYLHNCLHVTSFFNGIQPQCTLSTNFQRASTLLPHCAPITTLL